MKNPHAAQGAVTILAGLAMFGGLALASRFPELRGLLLTIGIGGPVVLVLYVAGLMED